MKKYQDRDTIRGKTMMLVFKETVLLSEWQCERQKNSEHSHTFFKVNIFFIIVQSIFSKIAPLWDRQLQLVIGHFFLYIKDEHLSEDSIPLSGQNVLSRWWLVSDGCPILRETYAWHCIVLSSHYNTVQKHNNKEKSKTMRNLTTPCINLSEYWTSML